MPVKLTLLVTCSYPHCTAAAQIEMGSWGSTRERPKNLSDGWYWHDKLQACPEHAGALREADEAAYRWACSRTEAMNKARRAVAKAHPQPAHPAWLAPVWDARASET